MNTEELKMVMEAVGRMSETAGNAAQWWLVLHYGASMLTSVCFLVGILGAVAIVAKGCRRVAIEGNKWAELGQRVARRMGGDGSEYSFERDERKMNQILSKLEREISP